ncbi:MAG TPA: hypothetical protein VKA30_09795 [Actinomycetota bacterium]|nr:hypothetical protein [Actinomycetota bacterium]
MSTTAGAIRIHRPTTAPRSAWRVAAAVAVLSASAAAGVYAGRATAPSAAVPTVRPVVQEGSIVSRRPLSDATYNVGGARFGIERPTAQDDSPAGMHGRQIAR